MPALLCENAGGGEDTADNAASAGGDMNNREQWEQHVKAVASKRGNKYGAKRVQVDGYWFDSKAEAKRYSELKLMKQAGLIRDLLLHPSYPIEINNIEICRVELDFVYYVPAGPDNDDFGLKFEDVKGKDNPLSQLKRKLVEAFYGIKVEVIK